jgi:hypothetical protein
MQEESKLCSEMSALTIQGPGESPKRKNTTFKTAKVLNQEYRRRFGACVVWI